MHIDPSSPDFPGKKKWEKPDFVIIDSNEPGDGGLKTAFREHSVKGGNYYISPKGNPASLIPVNKGTFNQYDS